ncbi:hypothetical protein ACJDU8_04380 [Clostridium sp. WILCCON 0269]|uniref:NrS-1 polymerase-like HBD domain-containing protein n=1 Tax=Candidatus Clostridium eludens TaxID=3381663 RepID=A0ABW8SFJ2_9CLOT
MQYINNNFDKIPQELKNYNNWVLWRLESRKGKKTKIPYQTNDKVESSTNPNTWITFSTVVKIYINKSNKYSGIGFMFSNTDITGVDIDNCTINGEINEHAQRIIKQFNSYTERNQSGTGIHILVKGKISKVIKKDIEIYGEGRYFALTGDKICGDSIEDRQNIFNSQSEADQALCNHLAFWLDKDYNNIDIT